MKEDEIKKVVREGYAQIARRESSCCGTPVSACEISSKIGYSEEEMNSVPKGANLGLGCGNPLALASLKPGEVVLDLGSGAGFDCFLAARQVGEQGRVIGVDMTPEMIAKARENARKGAYRNVEFRLGEIESLPVADNSIDLVISNCVINLAPDKERVFRETFRVLKPGGRIMVSDIVILKALPKGLLESTGAYVACLSGAIEKNEYMAKILSAGFEKTEVVEETSFTMDLFQSDPLITSLIDQYGLSLEELKSSINAVSSIKVSAKKPAIK